MKIVKTPMGTMEQVVALEQAVLLIVVMLVKLIMACRGHREMKIIMPHKILIMDIGQVSRPRSRSDPIGESEPFSGCETIYWDSFFFFFFLS